jgi:hypothetical protein
MARTNAEKNSMNGALTGVTDSKLIRSNSNHGPIGEVYKGTDGLWKSWAGYDLPTEFRGSWDLQTEAVFAINEAERLYSGELEGGYVGSI